MESGEVVDKEKQLIQEGEKRNEYRNTQNKMNR